MGTKRMVLGVGVNNEQVKFKGVHTREYLLWRSMLFRCYANDDSAKNSCYKGCRVSDDWLNFTVFKNDIRQMTGFNMSDWHLDKDILVVGNATYSKETCCFVPKKINTMLTHRKKGNNLNSVGVSKVVSSVSVKYKAVCRDGSKAVYLGRFDTESEARSAYVDFKKSVIVNIAEKYKKDIDPRVYDALLNYVV